MSGGRFDGNVEYWSPESDKASGVFGVTLTAFDPGSGQTAYIVGSAQILRIVPAADTNILFTDTADVTAPTSSNILLKAGEEYFISSGGRKFLLASVNTANIVPILQKGSVARNAKLN